MSKKNYNKSCDHYSEKTWRNRMPGKLPYKLKKNTFLGHSSVLSLHSSDNWGSRQLQRITLSLWVTEYGGKCFRIHLSKFHGYTVLSVLLEVQDLHLTLYPTNYTQIFYCFLYGQRKLPNLRTSQRIFASGIHTSENYSTHKFQRCFIRFWLYKTFDTGA